MSRKIRLLLAKASNNPFREEAEVCLLKAQEIMARHGLEMRDVQLEPGAPKKEILCKDATGPRRTPWWHLDLAIVLADNFKCYSLTGHYHEGTSVRFFGTKDDIEVAIAAFNFTVPVITRCANEYCRNNGYVPINRALKNDYIAGFLKGIEDKFAEQVATNQGWALVLAKDQDVIKAHENLKLKNARKRTRSSLDDDMAYTAGWARGKQFEPVRGAIEHS